LGEENERGGGVCHQFKGGGKGKHTRLGVRVEASGSAFVAQRRVGDIQEGMGVRNPKG